MQVNGTTVGVAAVVGLAIGAFATGQVGGVVLPLLFVLACPLMMMFVMASMSGGRGVDSSADPQDPRDDGVAARATRTRR